MAGVASKAEFKQRVEGFMAHPLYCRAVVKTEAKTKEALLKEFRAFCEAKFVDAEKFTRTFSSELHFFETLAEFLTEKKAPAGHVWSNSKKGGAGWLMTTKEKKKRRNSKKSNVEPVVEESSSVSDVESGSVSDVTERESSSVERELAAEAKRCVRAQRVVQYN